MNDDQASLNTMGTRGATAMVNLTDGTAQPADHKECVVPYWRHMLNQFVRQAKDL